MSDVVVIGDLMLDVTAAAGSLARGGDVHGEVRLDPGGSASNVAVWAAQAGARVRLVGAVGDDAAGRVLLEALAARGITTAVKVVPGARTGMMLVFSEAGERSMVAHRGANSRLTTDDLPDPLEAAVVFVSGYTLYDPNSEPVARAAFARARARVLATDAASWPLIAKRGPTWFFAATSRVTVLFANEREAETLTGLQDDAAALALAERYPVAIVKLGDRGAVAAQSGTIARVPAVPITELDPTGAGDAFDGACLAALARGQSLEAALHQACTAGSQSAAHHGRWPETGHP